MLLPHCAPWGCFVLLKITSTGGLKSCIVDGQCVSVVFMFQSWGAVAQLLQNLWCLGFVMGSPHCQSIRDLSWVDAGTIT